MEWICRRCVKKQPELEVERDTELEKECSICGTKTWCFLIAKSRNTTDTLVYDKITPVEPELEAESTEENEAIAEVIEEAVEAEIEDAVPEEREPEEQPLEAESPPLSKIELKDIEESEKEYEAKLKAEKAKKAEIARLEAELEALRK